jgi:Ca2+-binding RTX toxin-like protein
LVSTGAANKVTSLTNASAALTTLNISGDKALTLTESLVGVKTINASTTTGGVTLDVSGVTKPITFAFTGGTGNDTLTVAAGQLATTALTSGAQLDFGTGTDTLVIKDTTPVYATINAAKGLEVVEMGVTAGTFDMAQLTPTQVAFSSVAAGTVSNLESTDSVTVKGAMATSLTVGGAVGNSNGTINIGTATTTGFTVASLVTTGLTNVALSSNGTNAAANVITGMTNSDNSNFTITGSNDLTMSVTAGATVTGDKVDATAFTGKLVVTGSDLADIIIGGSGIDTITGGKGADVLTGGAGADTFSFSAAAGATSSGGTLGFFDEIKDFVIGTDKLQFTTVTDVVSVQQTAVQTAVTALASTATAAQIETAMATANTTDLGVSFAVFGGNTYVLYETTGASTGVVADDVFIKLTGVATLPTFAADVIA